MPTTKTQPSEIELPMVLHGSTMPALHKARGALRAALNATPAWRDAAADLAHLEQARPARQNVASAAVEVEVMLHESVESRKPFDLAKAIAAAIKGNERSAAAQAVQVAFAVTSEAFIQRLDQAVSTNRPAIHAALTEQMQTVVDQAREHVDVIGLDADAAIAAGIEEPYRLVQILRGQFGELIQARGTLENNLGWHVVRPEFGELRWLANPAAREVFEHWRAWKVDGALVNPKNVNDRKPLRAPWPDRRALGSGALETAAWFDFFVTNPAAVPWLPTVEQYDDAGDELDAYLRELRTERPAGRINITPPDPDPVYVENTKPARRRADAAVLG